MWSELREHLETRALRDGFDHWRSLARGRALPEQTSFDPSELPPHILPHIALLEVAHEPLDFRYRVIGDQIVRFLAQNHTGKWVSQIAHQAPPNPLYQRLAEIVQAREPGLSHMLFFDPQQDYLSNTEIILPLCRAGGQITRLLVFVDLMPESALV